MVEQIRPLVPRDNESGLRWLLPEFVATAEVLRGLGIVEGDARSRSRTAARRRSSPSRRARSRRRSGERPRPLQTEHDPVWLRNVDDPQWLTTLEGGKVVYLGYRLTTDDTYDLSERLFALAGSRRCDASSSTSASTTAATTRPTARCSTCCRGPPIQRSSSLLTGRSTFSAAGNFVADVDRGTTARIVGEPAGGAPSQWGDSAAIPLERVGLTLRVATSYWEFGPPGDKRAETPVDVPVEPTAADFFAGRDPVLARALALP